MRVGTLSIFQCRLLWLRKINLAHTEVEWQIRFLMMESRKAHQSLKMAVSNPQPPRVETIFKEGRL